GVATPTIRGRGDQRLTRPQNAPLGEDFDDAAARGGSSRPDLDAVSFAGRSPVAPVDSLQIGISRCRFRRQIEADYTDFSLAAPKSNQSRPNRVRRPPISSRSR